MSEEFKEKWNQIKKNKNKIIFSYDYAEMNYNNYKWIPIIIYDYKNNFIKFNKIEDRNSKDYQFVKLENIKLDFFRINTYYNSIEKSLKIKKYDCEIFEKMDNFKYFWEFNILKKQDSYEIIQILRGKLFYFVEELLDYNIYFTYNEYEKIIDFFKSIINLFKNYLEFINDKIEDLILKPLDNKYIQMADKISAVFSIYPEFIELCILIWKINEETFLYNNCKSKFEKNWKEEFLQPEILKTIFNLNSDMMIQIFIKENILSYKFLYYLFKFNEVIKSIINIDNMMYNKKMNFIDNLNIIFINENPNFYKINEPQDIKWLIKIYESWLKNEYKSFKLYKKCEQIKVKQLLKFLKNGTLEKKILSINYINNDIEIIKNSSIDKNIVYKNNLIKYGILEIIFGEYYHDEIIKKSYKIIEFISEFLIVNNLFQILKFLDNSYPDKAFFIFKILKHIKNKINFDIVIEFIDSFKNEDFENITENILDLVLVFIQPENNEEECLMKLFSYGENHNHTEKVNIIFNKSFELYWRVLLFLNENKVSNIKKQLKIKLTCIIKSLIKNIMFKNWISNYFEKLWNIIIINKNKFNCFLKIFNDILLAAIKFCDNKNITLFFNLMKEKKINIIFWGLLGSCKNKKEKLDLYFEILNNILLFNKEEFFFSEELFLKLWEIVIKSHENKNILVYFCKFLEKNYLKYLKNYDFFNKYFNNNFINKDKFTIEHFNIFIIIFIKYNLSQNNLVVNKINHIFKIKDFVNLKGLDNLFGFLTKCRNKDTLTIINDFFIQIFKFSFDEKIQNSKIKFNYLIENLIKWIINCYKNKEFYGIENIVLLINEYIENLTGNNYITSINKNEIYKNIFFEYKNHENKIILPNNITLLGLKIEIEKYILKYFDTKTSIILKNKYNIFKSSLYYEENIIGNFDLKSINLEIVSNKNKEIKKNDIKLIISNSLIKNNEIFNILFELINKENKMDGVLEFLQKFIIENKIMNNLINLNKNNIVINKIFNESNFYQICYINNYILFKFKNIKNWIKKINKNSALDFIFMFFKNHINDESFNNNETMFDLIILFNNLFINIKKEYDLLIIIKIIKTILNSEFNDFEKIFPVVFESFNLIIKNSNTKFINEINEIINLNLFNPNIEDESLLWKELEIYFNNILYLDKGEALLIAISKNLVDKISYDDLDNFIINLTLVSNIISLFDLNNIDKKSIIENIKINECIIKIFEYLLKNKFINKNENIKSYLFYNINILMKNIINKIEFIEYFERVINNINIFNKFIFNSKDNLNIICINIHERSYFYDFLITFTNTLIELRKYRYIKKYIVQITNIIIKINRNNSYLDWTRKFKEQSNNKEKGWVNLGCTCYMNSLLQQLYYSKPFKDNLVKFQYSKNDIILNSLKKLFILMDFSKSHYINPSFFFDLLIHPETKKCLNPTEQMDIEEFFLILTTKLEDEFKNYNLQSIFDQIYGGKIAHIIECQICKKETYRDEKYLSLNLQVKNMKHLENSFNLFTKGELLDGENKFFCENCKQKQPVIKKDMLLNLPNIMILILKRIDFDLNLLQNVKVNDYLEFEQTIDLKNYLYHSSKEEITTYNLKGFTVHQGSATSGHYFSFINNNNEWKEYNDTSITDFNMENLEDVAFGSKNNSSKSSAYILVYEKTELNFNNDIFDYKYDKDDIYKNDELYENLISKENKENIKNIFIEEKFDNLVCSMSEFDKKIELKNIIFKLNLYHFLFLKNRENDKKNAKLYNKIYSDLSNKNELELFIDLLKNKEILNEFLIDCPIYTKRILFKNLVFKTILIIYNNNFEELLKFIDLFNIFLDFFLNILKLKKIKYIKEVIEILIYFFEIDSYKNLKNLIIDYKLVFIFANLIDKENSNIENYINQYKIKENKKYKDKIYQSQIDIEIINNYTSYENINIIVDDNDLEINYSDIIEIYIVILNVYYANNLENLKNDDRILENILEENFENLNNSQSTIKSHPYDNNSDTININQPNYFISILFNKTLFNYILINVLNSNRLTKKFMSTYSILILKNKDYLLDLLSHLERFFITNKNSFLYKKVKNIFFIINSSIEYLFRINLASDCEYLIKSYFKLVLKIQINLEKREAFFRIYYEVLNRQILKFYWKNSDILKHLSINNNYFDIKIFNNDINENFKKLYNFYWNNQEFLSEYKNLEIYNSDNKKKWKNYEKSKISQNNKILNKIKNDKLSMLGYNFKYDSDDELCTEDLKQGDDIEVQKENELYLYQLGKVVYNWDNVLYIKLNNKEKKLIYYNLSKVNKGNLAYNEFNYK